MCDNLVWEPSHALSYLLAGCVDEADWYWVNGEGMLPDDEAAGC